MNVCVYRAGQEQTVLGHVLQELLAITAYRLVIVAIMHLAEEVMDFVNASQDGWDLDAHRVSKIQKFLLNNLLSILYD